MVDQYYLRQAKKLIPPGHYILPMSEPIRQSDLIYDFTTNQFLRADSLRWTFDTFSIPREEIICAIRKATLEGFETKRRSYSIQTKLF